MKNLKIAAVCCAVLMPALPVQALDDEGPRSVVRLGVIGTEIGEGMYTASAISLSVARGTSATGGIVGDASSVSTFAAASDLPGLFEDTNDDEPYEVRLFPDVQ